MYLWVTSKVHGIRGVTRLNFILFYDKRLFKLKRGNFTHFWEGYFWFGGLSHPERIFKIFQINDVTGLKFKYIQVKQLLTKPVCLFGF